jgi:long-chain fatty acid transport protein
MQPNKASYFFKLRSFLPTCPLSGSGWTSMLSVCALLSLSSTPSWAGGLYITEFGTPSMGVANAGAGAVADDSSSAWHNPAGMTRLSGTHAQGTAGLIYGNVKFDADSNTPVAGGDGGNAAINLAPVLNGSIVHSLTDNLKLGFALGSVAGAGLDYGSNWAGRQQNTKTQLVTLTGIPSIAYKMHWLSVGVGATINYGSLDTFKLKAPNQAESTIKLDGDDWAYGVTAGVLVEFSDHSRVGLKYLSETKYEFDGDLKVSGGAVGGINVNSTTTLEMPQMLVLNFYHEFNDQFAILATADWEDWSEFENVPVSVSKGGAAIPRNWKDTYKLAGGVHYRPTKPWLLMTGFAWDSSPVDSKDRTADMPADRQLRYAVGTTYQWHERLKLGANITYLDAGNAKINNNQTLKGDYKRNDIFFFALNASWKF